jgi:hypothetical protein
MCVQCLVCDTLLSTQNACVPKCFPCKVRRRNERFIRYSDSIRAFTVRGTNPGEVEIFPTRPGRPWSPPSHLYHWHSVSFPVVKRPVRGLGHPSSSSAEFKQYRCTFTSLLGLHGLFWGDLYL